MCCCVRVNQDPGFSYVCTEGICKHSLLIGHVEMSNNLCT